MIELMVSVTLFAIVLMMALGAILTIIDLNRKTQAMASVTNNINFAVDSIIRVIKSAEDITGTPSLAGCESSSNTQLKLMFIDTYNIFGQNQNGEEKVFVFFRHNCTDGTIERGVNINDAAPSTWSAITSESDMSIEKVEFNVTTSGQQKVELLIRGLATVGSEESEFIIQTTSTRRRN